MRKRLCILALAVVMVIAPAGCGKEEPAAETAAREGVEENTKKVPPQETGEEKETAEEDSSQMPSLGMDNGNYNGFQYLTASRLEEDDAKAVVYVPESEGLYQNRNTVTSENLGVRVSIELNPYIQSRQENYTMKENMEAYMEYSYDFDEFISTDYRDVETSEINEITKEAASVITSRLEYNAYTEEYNALWSLYYLVRTDDDRMFLVKIKIDSDDTTGYTEDLLEELSAYLGIELPYDSEEMQAKIDGYDATDEKNVFSTGNWKFELPKGWREDFDYEESYNEYAYAPGGDADSANCMIFISNDYVDEDTSYIRDISEGEMHHVIQEFLPEGASDVKCEILGDTAVGYTLKLYFEENEIRTVMYFVYDGYNVYTVMALEDGISTEAFEAAEQIINTAETR